MSKYSPLARYLEGQSAHEILLSFRDIEGILGAPLPASARRHRAWWSNNPENNVATKEWLDAGYRTERVDVNRERLVFRRIGAREVAEPAALAWRTEMAEIDAPEKTPGLGAEEHPLFGALKGMAYVPPGVDLTQPAEPDWEETWLKKWDERLTGPGWEIFRPEHE